MTSLKHLGDYKVERIRTLGPGAGKYGVYANRDPLPLLPISDHPSLYEAQAAAQRYIAADRRRAGQR